MRLFWLTLALVMLSCARPTGDTLEFQYPLSEGVDVTYFEICVNELPCTRRAPQSILFKAGDPATYHVVLPVRQAWKVTVKACSPSRGCSPPAAVSFTFPASA